MAFTEPTETLVNYPLNGSNRRFSIPFDYLQRSFIRVSLFAANKEEQLTLGVDFNFINDTTIETVKTYGGADGWTRIQLRRYTDAKRIVEFIDGSVLLAGDLNVATLQALHIAQEGRDSAFDMLTVNSEGNYDAKDRRIVNVVDGVDKNDAVNKGQLDKVVGEVNVLKEETKGYMDRAELAAKQAESVLELTIDPLTHYRHMLIAKGGEREVVLPFAPFNLLVTLNAGFQPQGYSYIVEGFKVKLAEPLIAGDILVILTNPPTETRSI